MQVLEILKKFFLILKYLKIGFLNNILLFFSLGIIDIFGIFLLGVSVKALQDFEKIFSKITSYIPYLNLEFLNIQIFFTFIFLIFLFRSILHLIIIFKNTKFVNECVVKLKNLALSTYLTSKVHDVEFLEIRNVINFLNIRPDDIGKILSKSLTLTKDLLVFILILIFLSIINFYFLIVSLAIFLTIGLFYFYFIKNKLSIFSDELNETRLSKLKIINSIFLIFKETKFKNSFLDFKKRSQDTDNKMANIGTMTTVFSSMPQIIIETTIIFLVCLIILIQTHFFEINENFYFSSVIFLVGAYRIKPFFVSSLEYLTSVKLAENSINAFYKLINKNKKLLQKNENLIEKFEINKIELQNINYSIQDKNIFKNLNFTARKGEPIFIYGDSGTGKSTLINLILNFKSPDNGNLLLNEIDIGSYNYDTYLFKINYLQQEPSIFNASILENITLKEKSNTDFKKLDQIIKISNLTDFFNKTCKSNYDYILKEMGSNLSGGEKQRIMLARILYDINEVIILDEPVKSLDEKNQIEITKHLVENFKDKIFIFLSHNPKLEKYFKKVLFIKDGKIIEKKK